MAASKVEIVFVYTLELTETLSGAYYTSNKSSSKKISTNSHLLHQPQLCQKCHLEMCSKCVGGQNP